MTIVRITYTPRSNLIALMFHKLLEPDEVKDLLKSLNSIHKGIQAEGSSLLDKLTVWTYRNPDAADIANGCTPMFLKSSVDANSDLVKREAQVVLDYLRTKTSYSVESVIRDAKTTTIVDNFSSEQPYE